jgi:hypothetical protein
MRSEFTGIIERDGGGISLIAPKFRALTAWGIQEEALESLAGAIKLVLKHHRADALLGCFPTLCGKS